MCPVSEVDGIQRWDFKAGNGEPIGVLVPRWNGDWVRFKDHDRVACRLLAERDEKARELDELKGRIEEKAARADTVASGEDNYRVRAVLREQASLLRSLVQEGQGRECEKPEPAPRCTCGRYVEGDWHTRDCAYGRSAPAATSDGGGESNG